MSLIRQCDRCGKQIELEPNALAPFGWIKLEKEDVCDACEKDLRTFMRTPPPKAMTARE